MNGYTSRLRALVEMEIDLIPRFLTGRMWEEWWVQRGFRVAYDGTPRDRERDLVVQPSAEMLVYIRGQAVAAERIEADIGFGTTLRPNWAADDLKAIPILTFEAYLDGHAWEIHSRPRGYRLYRNLSKPHARVISIPSRHDDPMYVDMLDLAIEEVAAHEGRSSLAVYYDLWCDANDPSAVATLRRLPVIEGSPNIDRYMDSIGLD